MTLYAGRTYKLEVWGAKGGNGYGSHKYNLGGNGAYATGVYIPTTNKTLYVYVGGQGTYGSSSSSYAGGYNGGGQGYYYSGGGGGATHMAFASGLLTSRSGDYNTNLLLVGAGGGGGENRSTNNSSYYNYYASRGGVGGAYVGEDGTWEKNYNGGTYYSTGGSQTAGGICQGYNNSTYNGSFGQGGRYYTSYAGGGGAGFYGGAGGYQYCSGAGGSSYANTNLLTSTKLIAGNDNMPATSGSGTIVGRNGDGYAKVTYTYNGQAYLVLNPAEPVQSPRLDIQQGKKLGNYKVTVDVYPQYTDGNGAELKIGTVEGTSFTVLKGLKEYTDNITAIVTVSDYGGTYTLNLNQYSGESRVIALQAVDYPMSVYSVMVEEAAVCDAHAPANLTAVVDEASGDVLIKWDNDDVIANGSGWYIEYSSQYYGAWDSYTTTDSFYIFPAYSLNSEDLCIVTVYADCGGEYSIPVNVSFKTPCKDQYQSVPVFEDFSYNYYPDYPNNCWADFDDPDNVVLVTAAYPSGGGNSVKNVSGGSTSTMTLYANTKYKFQVWGAAGGYGYTATYSPGGKGGYAEGYYTPSTNTVIYIYAGGKGTNGTSSSTYSGGYNGGGSGYYYSGGGGGASHIAFRSGLLQNLE